MPLYYSDLHSSPLRDLRPSRSPQAPFLAGVNLSVPGFNMAPNLNKWEKYCQIRLGFEPRRPESLALPTELFGKSN